MANRLYVGNLPYQVTEQHLRDAFGPHGEVVSASVVMDRATGRSRGFGFVEMATPEQATKATEAMNGALLEGRPLTVNEARERAPRTGGFGGAPGGPRPFTGDRPGGFRGGAGAGGGGGGGYGGDRGGPAPAPTWEGAGPARGSDKRRERDRSDREDGGRGGRGGGGGGGGRGGW